MPKLIDKEEKKQFICSEAYKVFVTYGIDKFSLNKFIIDMNMSKGQFYHYFTTKEQLVYQVISKKTIELINSTVEEYKKEENFINKLNLIFAIYISEEKYYSDLKKLVIDTMHIYINSRDNEIKEFNNTMYQTIFNILEQLFDEEIKKGNFHKNSKLISKSICATADGMFLQSLMIENYNLNFELSNYFLEIEKLLKNNLKG